MVHEKAALVRGAIITSYAQVEAFLLDLVMRVRVRPDYAGVYDKFPYRLEDRIKAVRKIMAHPGLLHAYRDDMEALVDGLLPFEEIRHMMAHGLQTITFQHPGEHTLTYRLYRPGKGGKIEAGVMVTDLAQLGNATLKIARYSNEVVELFYRIYTEQGIEPV